MQTEMALQTKNRSEPAKNRFSVALLYRNNTRGGQPTNPQPDQSICCLYIVLHYF